MKDLHNTRIMFHNVNGLSARRGAEGFDTFANEQNLIQVDVQGFSEHCLDTTKYTIYQEAYETINRFFPGQASLQLSSSTEPAVNVYKPGGTGILVLGELVSRQEPRGKGGDAMGRWSYLHLRRHHLPPLTIISAYQVCPRPTNAIGNTAYHQQQRAIAKSDQIHIHPRQAFIQDLSKFVSDLTSKGHDIILGGDFNESLDDKHSGILKLITKNDLIDPFLHKFPHHPQFGTHVMGHRRIDMLFVTARLLSSMVKIGYAPFSYTNMSDHRPILVEFDTKTLFGQHLHPMRPASTRSVKTKDKKSVTRFIHKWYQMLEHHNAFDYRLQLEDDSAAESVVELLDELIGVCGDSAEKACKRRRSEYFTCQLVQQRLRVSILRGHLNSLRMGLDRSTQLRRRMLRAGLDFHLPETRRLTSEALTQARIDLKETCQHHSEVRQKELDEKIAQATLRKNKNKAQILRAIQKSEDNQKTYRILQAMKRRNNETQSIDRLEIPSTWPPVDQPVTTLQQLEDPKLATTWRTVTNPREIEYYLLLRNRLHFGQAEGTPFTCRPLLDELDWTATTPFADLTLQGQYQLESPIPQCDDLLKACKAITNLDSLPDVISVAEFRAKIQAWRETTTTSPSGRHLGRYKALFAVGLPPDSESDQTGPQTGGLSFRDKQDSIAALIVSVINYCIRHNYVLNRWKKVINVMIFKELGNFQIHRLRIIHIYEADFNLILAVKWRQLLRESDKQGTLNEGQYGGRPGCEAQSLTFLEELKYDISYLTRRTLVNFDNDAASCYDRIVVPFASLVNRKYGLHRQIVSLHGSALRQAKFYLKTSAGVSETSYSHCQSFPIHGTGQGSGNSPSIWLFISSTLFDVHRSLSHGARFVSPDNTESVSLSMVGFVDDATGTCNDFRPQLEAPIHELLRQMQHDAQLWNNLLYCSGGKLELSKCSFHVLRFNFKPNGTPMPDISRYDEQIQLIDQETKARVSISSKLPFEPHKTLGHFKSPSSRLRRELTAITDKAARLSLLISVSPLTRQGAYLAYHSVYIPSISYSLPQSFFTKRELDLVQGHSMPSIIAKCGYNRHTSRVLLFTPKSYAGGGFLPWYMLQGEGQIKLFLKHWRTNTLISRTLRITLAWAQWQAGHPHPILQDTTTQLPYIECRWLASLRSFLAHIQASLHVDKPFVAMPERQHDMYIMEIARSSRLFNDHDMKVINYCRLYLHITTLSELFQADGRTLIASLYDCKREPWFDQDTFITLQHRPSEFQVRTKWQRLIRQFTTSSGELANSMTLGPWTVLGHHLRRRRQTYLQKSSGAVYHWHGTSYCEYRSTHDGGSRYKLIRSSQWRPDELSIPLDVKTQPDGTLYLAEPGATGDALVASLPPIRDFQQYLNTLSTWEQDLLQGIHLHYRPYEIRQFLSKAEEPSLLAVSDGSQRDDTLTFGWVLGTPEGTVFAEHSGIGSGTPTSHRAEAWGMLSICLFLRHVFRYTLGLEENPLRRISATFLSDNNGLITRLHKRMEYTTLYPNATLAPDWDLVEQIWTTIRDMSTVDATFKWIRGHQDADDPNITVEATFNIRADNLAGSISSDRSPLCDHNIMVPAEKCTLMIAQAPIHGHYNQAIRNAYTLPPFYEYVEHRYKLTSDQRQQIDWSIFTRTASNFPASSVQLLKLVHDKLPTNSELAKSNPLQSDRCHYCSERETFSHLCQCANPISDKFRQDLLATVTHYMEHRAVPAIFQATFLHCVRISLEIPTTVPDIPSVAPYIEAQGTLGSRSILQGLWTKQWNQLYNRATRFYSLETPPNTIEFLSGMLKIVWETQLQFWKTHCESISTPSGSPVSQAEDKIQQLQTKIRLLHASRTQCLHAHREVYFYSDVDEFLRTATGAQMRAYLHHYESAIRTSIDMAARHRNRSLFTYPGFTRTSSRPHHHPKITPPTTPLHAQPDSIPHTTTQQDIQGANMNRKHTRWKQSLQFVRTLPSFFSAKPA